MLISCLGGEVKIHGIVAGDKFKDGLSFVSLAWTDKIGDKSGLQRD